MAHSLPSGIISATPTVTTTAPGTGDPAGREAVSQRTADQSERHRAERERQHGQPDLGGRGADQVQGRAVPSSNQAGPCSAVEVSESIRAAAAIVNRPTSARSRHRGRAMAVPAGAGSARSPPRRGLPARSGRRSMGQPACSISRPPRTGPLTPPSGPRVITMPMARPRLSGRDATVVSTGGQRKQHRGERALDDPGREQPADGRRRGLPADRPRGHRAPADGGRLAPTRGRRVAAPELRHGAQLPRISGQ